MDDNGSGLVMGTKSVMKEDNESELPMGKSYDMTNNGGNLEYNSHRKKKGCPVVIIDRQLSISVKNQQYLPLKWLRVSLGEEPEMEYQTEAAETDNVELEESNLNDDDIKEDMKAVQCNG